MDVRCNRCSTEYEFDDALVSERGTTVKCTNCGHQFKVFPGGGHRAPERWIVRKASGRELVYTSLKDLQRAIAQRHVGPTDMLSRGPAEPLRPLGSIAELTPFFEAQARPPIKRQGGTLLGVAPQGGARRGQEDTVPDAAPFNTTMPAVSGPPRVGTPAGGFTAAGPARAVPRPGAAGVRYGEEEAEPATMPRAPLPTGERREAPSAIPATSPSQPHAADIASALATPLPPGIGQLGSMQTELDRPRQLPPVGREAAPAHESTEPQLTPTPSAVSEAYRAYQESYPDTRFASAGPSPRRSRARWAVAVAVIGLTVFVVAVFARRYLTRVASEQKQEQPAVARDERVVAMLKQGNAALNEGDFEGAKEQFDKASVLADKDPEVLAALARLEATRADVHWLALRVIDVADSAASSNERAELGKRLDRAKKAAAVAAQVASDDPSVRRARVDALRLEGKLAEARQLVAQMRPDPSDPETAYVLAALDLADTLPVWSTIVDRLRTAAGVEGGIGRARAALVYALASSGAPEEAGQELVKLETAKHPHPLASRLRAFVERTKLVAADPSAAPVASGGVPVAGEPGGAEALPGGDFRKLLEDASAARQRGDLARAEALYRAAREKNPGNVEALAGLADVARMRGDTENARKLYEGVLAANPSYVPSLVALADLKWGSGDRAGAAALYKRVLAQTGPGTAYGQRASARIAEHEGAGSKPAAAEPSPAPPAEQPSPPPQPPAESPHIDTTDLPGFQQ